MYSTHRNIVSESHQEMEEILMDDAVEPYALYMYKKTAKEGGERPVRFEVNYHKMRINHSRPKSIGKSKRMLAANGHQDHVIVDSPCNIGGSLPASTEIEHKRTFTGDVTLIKPVIFGDSARLQMESDYLIPNSSYHKSLAAHGCFTPVKEDLECSVKHIFASPAKTVTQASVVFSDKTEEGDFTIDSTVRGKVYINVIDQETNEFKRTIEGDIHQIISFAQQNEGSPWNHFEVDHAKKCARFTTQGRFRLVAQIKSKLSTSEERMSANQCCDDCCCCVIQ